MIPRILRAAFACALAFPFTLQAQQDVTTASLTGRVSDPTGAALPHAAVFATRAETNQTTTTETDAQGRFRFPYLAVGAYRIAATAPNFAPADRTLTLNIGAAFDLVLTLHIATATQQTTVTSDAPLIESNRSQTSETVLETEVANLPFEGRNYLDLALLLPGVSPTNTASTQTLAETSEVPGQGYSVNSQRNVSNSFVVDGLSANDDAAGLAGNLLSMDTVRQFQVVTSGGQAEFGRALGGYFNILTRSGTNQLHGTAYGFLRNQRFAAQNPLSRTTLPLTQGQYGASLSGPLVHDRTFLFGNFEEQRLRTNGIITVTPANALAINSRLASVGYAAPLLPTSNLYPNTLHTDTVFLRVDHRISPNDQLNARYSFYHLASLNARGVGALNEVSNGTSVYDTNHTLALSNIATLTPRTFNETRAQFIYDDLYAPPNDLLGPAVTISGVAIFGRSTSSPTARTNYLGELVDNLVLQRSAHTFKLGADFLYNATTITFPQSLRGSYSFASLAAFQSGTYNSQGFTQNFGNPVVAQRNPNLGLYAQDEWKVSPSLTLNLGVRYDLEWLETIATDINNVSPRIGLAWSPFIHHRTVVRASYGLYYDRIPLRPLANALLSAHNTTDLAQATLLSYTFSPCTTTPCTTGAPAFPGIASTPPAGSIENFSLMDTHIKNAASQQISLGVEQQLATNTRLALSYQHLRGEHLLGSINTNINPDGSRPDPTRGNIKPYTSAFDSYFDGLEATLEQRPTTWASARISYTYSKAISNLSEFFFSSPINNFNLRQDRSRSDDDQRHRLVFNAALNSPTARPHGWAEAATHGWRLNGILQYYSKLPFNIITGANTRQGTAQRPCTGGYSLTTTNPCTEGLAVIGRNTGTGLDFFALNARLSRTVSLTDRIKLEGMAELYNALNHRNNMLPNNTITSAQYGTPNAVGDPRNLQLGARVTF